jgi:hypothetical protein
MHRTKLWRSLHRGITAFAAGTALGATLAIGGGMSPTAAKAESVGPDIGGRTTIDNWDDWDEGYAYELGCAVDVSTIGQVITVPAGMHTLKKFTFSLQSDRTPGQMVVRGEVYAWNGTMATGDAIAETRPQTIATQGWVRIRYKVNAAVRPGRQYIIFESVDKDYESCTAGYGDYPESEGGCPGIFFQSNAGDETRWTTVPWRDYCGTMRMIVVFWHHH